MQCQKYRVDGVKKAEVTIFTLALTSDQKKVIYHKISGPDWDLASDTELEVVWKSADGLRVVASWINKKFGRDNKMLSPVYVFDIDYQKPIFKATSVGGILDFAEVLSSPWVYECMRMD